MATGLLRRIEVRFRMNGSVMRMLSLLSILWPVLTSAPGVSVEPGSPHWAFSPLSRPAVPDAPGIRARTPIDRFVAARLREKGLSISPPAGRGTLLRRLTFDLLGLPPTPEELEGFLADESPDAYERLVDRLLASPRYGERWGRHWLDVARYADNKGYVFFERKEFPWAYTYRDWVVEALNEDLPFDRFVLAQLAADQLEPARGEAPPLAAMGFLTVGGRFMNNTHDVIDDRIDVVSRGLLALTVSCARCHDHKYDPIPQADYYSLYGVFRSSVEPVLPPSLNGRPETDEERAFAAEMEKREKALNDFVDRKHAELVEDARSRIADYLIAAHARRDQPPTDDFMLLIPKGELNPTVILRWQVYLEARREGFDPVWAPWHALASRPESELARSASSILDRLETRAAGGDRVNPLVIEALRKSGIASMKDVAAVYASLLTAVSESWRSELDRASRSGKEPPTRLEDPDEEELRLALHGDDAPAKVPRMLGWGFLALFPDRPTQDEYKKLLGAVEKWSVEGPGAPARAMVLLDSGRPHDSRVFQRGNPNRLGRSVPRQFLAALRPDRAPFRKGSGRLELAREIVRRANPLTARVIVNRIWQHHFGTGLVRTQDDFGRRGEPPTHPRLLDWLASTLVEEGWSIKQVHRWILLSAVYRQASREREDAARVDADNRLLWRQNRRRLGFEATRDAMLAAGDCLDPSMGGPPADILGAFSRRRSIYGFVNRMDVAPLLTTFDFPNPASTCGRREETTVPPQALYLMNNAFVVEVAEHVAARGDLAALEARDRVERVYTILFGRRPGVEEHELAREYLGRQASEERWSRYAQALLMTNEFVFID